MEGLKTEWHWQDLATSYKARLDVLEEELAVLKEKQRFVLKDADFSAAMLFGLTKNEAIIFHYLLGKPTATREALMQIIYLGDHGREMVDIKIIDVWVCKLRKKLMTHGIEIKTMWGRGYFMAPGMKLKAEELVAPLREAVS